MDTYFFLKEEDYNTLRTTPANAHAIASIVGKKRPCLLSWSDGDSMFDVLFTVEPTTDRRNSRNFQSGTKKSDLFISVLGKGAFGFEITLEPTHPSYYAEKLNIPNIPSELADLFNWVRNNLAQ